MKGTTDYSRLQEQSAPLIFNEHKISINQKRGLEDENAYKKCLEDILKGSWVARQKLVNYFDSTPQEFHAQDLLEQRKKKIFDYLTEHSNANNHFATSLLGTCYLYGYGVKKSVSQAVQFYQKAAFEQNPWGQFGLALCFYHGQGVKQDDKECVNNLRLAASQKYPPALEYLGYMLFHGLGTFQSYPEALKYFKEAEALGSGLASFRIGMMYELGIGVSHDNDQAELFYKKAIQNGYPDAQKRLDQLDNFSGWNPRYNYATYLYIPKFEKEFNLNITPNNVTEITGSAAAGIKSYEVTESYTVKFIYQGSDPQLYGRTIVEKKIEEFTKSKVAIELAKQRIAQQRVRKQQKTKERNQLEMANLSPPSQYLKMFCDNRVRIGVGTSVLLEFIGILLLAVNNEKTEADRFTAGIILIIFPLISLGCFLGKWFQRREDEERTLKLQIALQKSTEAIVSIWKEADSQFNTLLSGMISTNPMKPTLEKKSDGSVSVEYAGVSLS